MSGLADRLVQVAAQAMDDSDPDWKPLEWYRQHVRAALGAALVELNTEVWRREQVDEDPIDLTALAGVVERGE